MEQGDPGGPGSPSNGGAAWCQERDTASSPPSLPYPTPPLSLLLLCLRSLRLFPFLLLLLPFQPSSPYQSNPTCQALVLAQCLGHSHCGKGDRQWTSKPIGNVGAEKHSGGDETGRECVGGGCCRARGGPGSPLNSDLGGKEATTRTVGGGTASTKSLRQDQARDTERSWRE